MNPIRLTRPDQGEHFLAGTDVVTIKATGQDTSGTMLVVEVRVPPGGGPPVLHRHNSAKVFYFLEGEFDLTTLDAAQTQMRTTRARSGDLVAIPAMAWHNIKNVGTATGRYFGIHSPGWMEDFVRELGQPIEDPLHPPQPAGPPSDAQRRQMLATITNYMEILNPRPLVS